MEIIDNNACSPHVHLSSQLGISRKILNIINNIIALSKLETANFLVVFYSFFSAKRLKINIDLVPQCLARLIEG